MSSAASHERHVEFSVARNPDGSIDMSRRFIKLPPGVVRPKDVFDINFSPLAGNHIGVWPSADDEGLIELHALHGAPEAFVAPVDMGNGRTVERQTAIFEKLAELVHERSL